MLKKKITIEGLARMVKRGFDEMATKEDVKALAAIMAAEFERTKAAIHDIKINSDMLVRVSGGHEYEIQKLRFRVSRLEKKVGLTK